MLDNRKVALYCRTARADDNAIENQKQALINYAEENGFNNIAFYIDNGISGIIFDRPTLSRLISDIKAGMISVVIVSSFSRFSRKPFEADRFIKSMFLKYGVRFISVLDGYDTAR